MLQDPGRLYGMVDPEMLPALQAAETDSFKNLTDFEIEIRMRGDNGQWRWMRLRSHPHRTSGGLVVWDGLATDITERRQAEAEREKLQAQLIQAQKMESVGRLASGVARDYNNLLTVIIGYAELAMNKVSPEDPVHRDLETILGAAARSREITRQLLAFARRETIAPVVLDLNSTVENILRILRWLIGEDIELAWSPGNAVWPVLMDPVQIDQMLANLCVNARDAISDVGKITIETDNVTLDAVNCADYDGFVPGDFAVLTVSDDGCGMARETLDNIFEPFFTTKEEGQGCPGREGVRACPKRRQAMK